MGWFKLSAGLDGGLFSFASTMEIEIEPSLNRYHLFLVASENGGACLLVAVSPFLLLQNAKALYRHIAISHRPQCHRHIAAPTASWPYRIAMAQRPQPLRHGGDAIASLYGDPVAMDYMALQRLRGFC
jgi:hypothetical protein